MSKLRSLILIIIFIAFNWCLPLACPSVRWNTYMQSARPQSSCLSEWHAFVLTRIWFLDGNSSTLIGWPGQSNEWMSWSDWLFCFNRVHYKLNGFAQFFFCLFLNLSLSWLWIVIHSRDIVSYFVLSSSLFTEYTSNACDSWSEP